MTFRKIGDKWVFTAHGVNFALTSDELTEMRGLLDFIEDTEKGEIDDAS